MRHAIYLIYGLLVLGFVGFAEYRGWTLSSVDEGKVPPKSVRDNPGSYRSHYVFFPHHIGGK